MINKNVFKSLKATGVSFLLLCAFLPAFAAGDPPAPVTLQVALFMKVLPMYTNLGAEPFTLHVIGSPEIAAEFKKSVGKKAGKATLEGVTAGTGAPAGKAKVVYFGENVKAGLDFCQSNKVLSITGDTALVPEGVTLGVGIGGNGKPKFVLNLSSSKAEGVNWHPAILKISETVQ